jgi:lipocalin
MNRKLLLSASLIASSILSDAQDANRTYAITGKEKNIYMWADIKQVDVSSGKIVKTLFESEKTTFKFNSLDKTANLNAQDVNPTSYGVAACALDLRSNRLYFAPMHFSEIRYMDLDKTEANFTTVKRNVIATPNNSPYQPEENQITRMVIAADGYGYALTNDANHLIRFSTGRKNEVEDLGNLVDAESNKGISVHNKCTSWGGDMLADAFGKLIIISASHNMYSVDIKTRVATHTGTIVGLPANFTTNGAVVDNEGNIVVSSANVFEGLFKFNFKDLKATKVPTTEKAFNASDLANGNLLFQKEADAANTFDVSKSILPGFVSSSEARVFPNPITTEQFSVLFDGQNAAGRYTVLFTDLAGRTLQTKVVNVVKGGQVENIRLANKTAKGLYLVKVIDENKKIAFSEKVVLQ